MENRLIAAFRLSADLGKQFVVFRMRAYPNPKKTALNRRGNCAVIGTDAGDQT